MFVSFEGHFITAAHVLKDHFKWSKKTGEPEGDCFPIVYVPSPTWETPRWFKFKNCMVDETIDVAVCKTQDNPFGITGLHVSRLDLIPKEPPDGTAVAFTGFPQYITVPVTSRGHTASIGAFFGKDRRLILVDKTTWHGVSGGPLYLTDGSVIGIISKLGENLWEGMAFATPAAPIIKFLSDKKIPAWHEDAQQTNEPPKKKKK